MTTTPWCNYPLDLTGQVTTNRVVETIDPKGRGPLIVPRYFPYYATSLVVMDASTHTFIDEGTHYVPHLLHDELTLKTGKSVYCYIELKAIESYETKAIRLEYQTVGGHYNSPNLTHIEAMINKEKPEGVDFHHLKNTPDLYPPKPHFHHIAQDLRGYAEFLKAMEELRQVLLESNNPLPIATLEEALKGERNDCIMTPRQVRAVLDYLKTSEPPHED